MQDAASFSEDFLQFLFQPIVALSVEQIREISPLEVCKWLRDFNLYWHPRETGVFQMELKASSLKLKDRGIRE